jgi:hypothetical protein
VYEKSLNEAELILRRERERLLPVRSVWEEVVKRSKLAGFEVAALAGDRRFQISPARVEGEEPGEEPQAGDGLDDAEMEQLGFFPEDRVRLVTPSVVQEEPGEENEEIGSIRRRAFINQPENRGKTADRKAATVSLVPKKRADRKNKKTGKRALKTFQRKKRGPALRARKSKMRTRKKK